MREPWLEMVGEWIRNAAIDVTVEIGTVKAKKWIIAINKESKAGCIFSEDGTMVGKIVLPDSN